tara:strand:- start:455 stop:664 length:210 start_codon:yes stop_codon:yes gene_type:complete
MKKQQFKVGDIITEKDKSGGMRSALSVIVSISARKHFPGLRQFKIMNVKTGKRFLISQEYAERYLKAIA